MTEEKISHLGVEKFNPNSEVSFKEWKDKMLSAMYVMMERLRYDAQKRLPQLIIDFEVEDILMGTKDMPVAPLKANYEGDCGFEEAKKEYVALSCIWRQITGNLINILFQRMPTGFWKSRGISFSDVKNGSGKVKIHDMWRKVLQVYENSSEHELKLAMIEWMKAS